MAQDDRANRAPVRAALLVTSRGHHIGDPKRVYWNNVIIDAMGYVGQDKPHGAECGTVRRLTKLLLLNKFDNVIQIRGGARRF